MHVLIATGKKIVHPLSSVGKGLEGGNKFMS